jgi:hypothetical protein
VVRRIGIESLFDGTCCHAHRLTACGYFYGLEIPLLDRTTYERFDLGGDLFVEGGTERRSFFLPSSETSIGRVSQMFSLMATNRSQVPRNV